MEKLKLHSPAPDPRTPPALVNLANSLDGKTVEEGAGLAYIAGALSGISKNAFVHKAKDAIEVHWRVAPKGRVEYILIKYTEVE